MTHAANVISVVGILYVSATSASISQSLSPAAESGAAGALPEIRVEVSLGRSEIREQVAAQLGIDPAGVPLSVGLPEDVAREVCRMEDFSGTDAARSCTATRFAPVLVEAASTTSR